MTNLVANLANMITTNISEMNNTITKNISEMEISQQNIIRNFSYTILSLAVKTKEMLIFKKASTSILSISGGLGTRK